MILKFYKIELSVQMDYKPYMGHVQLGTRLIKDISNLVQ